MTEDVAYRNPCASVHPQRIGGVLYYPPGKIRLANGEVVDTKEFALDVAEAIGRGDTVVFPAVESPGGHRLWEFVPLSSDLPTVEARDD